MSDHAGWSKSIGANVRRYRLKRGLTQKEIAADRFTTSYVSQLERGEVTPSLKAILHLAQQLAVPRLTLLEPDDRGQSDLLRRASIHFFLGTYQEAATLLQKLRPGSLTDSQSARYALLRLRFLAAHNDWSAVSKHCQALSERPDTILTSPMLMIPHKYYSGKGHELLGNIHLALKEWESAFSGRDAPPITPTPELFLLAHDLAALYHKLGNRTAAHQLARIWAPFNADTLSLEDLVRWVLSPPAIGPDSPEQFVDAAGPSVAAPETLLEVAEAWAMAVYTLRILQSLPRPARPPGTATDDS